MLAGRFASEFKHFQSSYLGSLLAVLAKRDCRITYLVVFPRIAKSV
jgi:hypothetical protein